MAEFASFPLPNCHRGQLDGRRVTRLDPPRTSVSETCRQSSHTNTRNDVNKKEENNNNTPPLVQLQTCKYSLITVVQLNRLPDTLMMAIKQLKLHLLLKECT